MNANGSDKSRVTKEREILGASTADDSQPSYSPSRGKIVFSSDRDGDRDLYVMDIDGTDVRRLTNHPGADSSPERQLVQ